MTTTLQQAKSAVPSFAATSNVPQFDFQNSGFARPPQQPNNGGDNDDDDNGPPATLFLGAGDHLKHLMPIDVKESKFQAVPICLFQHIGQCGGNFIVNGFCSRHILAIFNGTIQTKNALISLNGSAKLVSMIGLVNQEPLVSIDNIASQTTAIFPVFELMSNNPEQKDFTLYSNRRTPLVGEQKWLYKIFTEQLSQSEQITLNNWLEYMSSFKFPKTGWYFLGNRSLDLTKCTLVTQAFCSLFQPQATEIGGITQCTFSGIGIYTDHHFVRNDSLYWEGTDPSRNIIGPWLIAPIVLSQNIPLRTAPFSTELQIAIKYNQQKVLYYN